MWFVIGACGLAWGLGLARTLALELHSRFFFDTIGTAICGVLCAGLVVAMTALRRNRCTSPWQTALHLTPLLLPLVDVVSGTFHAWRGPVLLTGSLALATLFVTQTSISRRAGVLIAVAIPLLVYLPDLSPYVGRADTFEFQVIAPRLGIAHPSGYPLYILVGKLFSLVPFGSVAWRVNLSSAVCAALASGALFLALTEDTSQRITNYKLRNLSSLQGITNHESPAQNPKSKTCGERSESIQNPKSNLPALIAALTLAFSPTLWSRAVEAEVYALNALLVAAGLWLAVRWASGRLSTAKALPLLGLLTGVAMASHVTLGALLLLVLPLMFTTRPRPTFRTLLYAGGLGLAGLALYLYIPLRWPAVNDGELMSLAHFLRFVTNAESAGALHPLAFVQDPARWGLVFRLLRVQVGWVGLLLSLCGLARLFRRHWPLALGSLLAFLAWVWFNLSFYVADPDYSSFLIPAHVMLVFWMGAGIANYELRNLSPLQGIANHQPKIQNPKSKITFPLLLLLPLSRLWITGPTLDTISVGREDEAWARYALRQPLAEGAAILADSEKFPPLYYLQQVEAIRPDLDLVTLFSEAQYREALEQRLNAGQRVYLARYLPSMDAFGVTAAGPLVEVRPPTHAAIPATSPVAQFGDALALRNHRLEADPEGRRMHHLTLVWHATAAIDDDLTVRLRLTDWSGNVVWESTPTRPVAGYTTTQAWQAEHATDDYHPLRWPQWIAPGNYVLEIGVFPRFAQEGLLVDDTSEVWFRLDNVTIYPESDHPPLSRQLNALFDGSIWLTGADFPGEVNAGGALTVDLTWQRGEYAPRATPEICWIDDDGVPQTAAAAHQATPYGASPLDWRPGRPQTVRYTVVAPLEPGRYTLSVGWQQLDGGDGDVITRCQWLGKAQSACALGDIQVNLSNVGLANFDSRIVLIDAAFDAEAALAGGELRIDLRWRGMRALDKDYTVFVQVVGPDGALYGQADSWPVQGARPTSGWQVGEEIEDVYRLYLKKNAPAGEYRIIAGWYLLADMGRLPTVDAAGASTGDFYTVGTFTVP